MRLIVIEWTRVEGGGEFCRVKVETIHVTYFRCHTLGVTTNWKLEAG